MGLGGAIDLRLHRGIVWRPGLHLGGCVGGYKTARIEIGGIGIDLRHRGNAEGHAGTQSDDAVFCHWLICSHFNRKLSYGYFYHLN